MRFAFSDEQYAFRGSLATLLARACPPQVVRAAWSSETGRSPALWSELAKLGVLGVCVPETHGGLGGDALDWVLLAEEAGRAALPEPLAHTAFVAAPFLDGNGRRRSRAASAGGGGAERRAGRGRAPGGSGPRRR